MTTTPREVILEVFIQEYTNPIRDVNSFTRSQLLTDAILSALDAADILLVHVPEPRRVKSWGNPQEEWTRGLMAGYGACRERGEG